jgi:beta-glucosidase
MATGLLLVKAPGTAYSAGNVYQDPNQPVEARVKDLLSRMTLEEKVGQMIQAEKNISADNVKNLFIGSLLSGGGNVPTPNNPTAWCDLIDNYQRAAMSTRLQIPIIYGIDAVHGHGNLYGATIFPHNIGLGATMDADLVKRTAQVVAKEVRATGIHWTFAPCIAAPQNSRWGRTYEGFSDNTDLVTQLGVACTVGFQGEDYINDLKLPTAIAACAKHYIGDGATTNGVNASEAPMTEAEMREKYLPPYIEAIKAGARTVMISYNTINGVECHANGRLITEILKNELKFDGIVITDYEAIKDISTDFRTCVKQSVNAGIDMFMEPRKYLDVITYLKDMVNKGEVSQARIDDAVTRILRVKFQMGLFEKPYADRSLMQSVGSEEHRAVAREAVRKSLVLLKNENRILPIPKSGKRIFVAGKNADNMGNQCGGWTIAWQGKSGNITPGTTILQGIKNTVSSGTTVTFNSTGSGAAGHDLAIVVVGETPYAEGKGDRTDLSLSTEDITAINNVKNSGVPMVVVLVSGRPMVISSQLNSMSALVAAWLPGTEGQGVADVLFGDFDFTGKLPMKWPVSTSQLPFKDGDGKVPQFDYGYGLTMNTAGYKISGYVNPDMDSSNQNIKAGFKVEIAGRQISSTTDRNGYFELTGVPAVDEGYTIRISKPEYLYRDISNVVVSSDKVLASQTDPIIVWAGDININGVQDNAINMTDIMEMAKAFNSVIGDGRYSAGSDVNKDNAVNMTDIMIVAKHFNTSPLSY